ncbi:MAG: hypothetical protein ABJA37_10330 [Ferruginibacter sp.]
MKKYILFSVLLFTAALSFAQADVNKYPEPEFSNEVYYLQKDSSNNVIRLEKNAAKMEAKTKLGGFGGYENGYTIDGSRSTVRISHGNSLSFVISTGAGAGQASTAERDSMMRANGMDPSMMQGMAGPGDPTSTIALYKIESEKGKRKILMQKSGGAIPFSSKKNQSSDKYTFSVRKIKTGYSELVIDKTLPNGEYAFTMMGGGMGSMDGSTTIFAFGVE